MSTPIEDELFELCREVYEKTGWEGTSHAYAQFQNHSSPEDQRSIVHTGYYSLGEIEDLSDKSYIFQLEVTPAYTSDYLLEKLPESIQNEEYEYLWRLNIKKGLAGYIADYENPMWVRDHKSSLTSRGIEHESMVSWREPVYGRTLIVALLKLTLALHEAGEL